MAAIEKDVKYCFFCGNQVTKGQKKIVCTTCRKSPNFSLPVEITPEELETQYKDVMIYCYNCGEKLFREDEVIMCPDGCGLIDIELKEIAGKELNSQTLEMTSGSTKSLTPQGRTIKNSNSDSSMYDCTHMTTRSKLIYNRIYFVYIVKLIQYSSDDNDKEQDDNFNKVSLCH